MVDNTNVNLNFHNLNDKLLIQVQNKTEMASSPFYSDESRAVRRKIRSKKKGSADNSLNGKDNLEIDRCVKWIMDNDFNKISLQFPDCLLDDSIEIAQELTLRTQKETFVLADTSYGRYSCCVDEVTAAHIDADAIIHFGHACLSFRNRVPLLYIFGKSSLDIADVIFAFKNSFPDKSIPVILYYEVNYYHAISKIAENLRDYRNLVVSEILYPNLPCNEKIASDNQIKVKRNQRYFILPKPRKLEDYTIFYIGCRIEAVSNVMLSLNKCKFYMYNTVDRTVTDDAFNVSRFFMQRNYYIEKMRDATIVGILVGSFGSSDYLCSIKRLRQALIAANKKCYVIVLGKINVSKLANFAEIEVFVNVACLESTIVDCCGFYQPIITPYELEIALNMRELTDRFITDFTELLPDGEYHVPVSEMKKETDVSLITGKIRTLGQSDICDESNNESAALVRRDEMVISEIHCRAAGEFLSQRSWKGLEQNLGETSAAGIQQGRKGIASEYEGERSVH